jgi:hypothetical protein
MEMTMIDEVQNLRDSMIAAAIKMERDEAAESGQDPVVNIATIAMRLPEDFALDEREFAAVIHALEAGDVPASVEPTEPEAPAMTADGARENIVRLHNELSAARGALISAEEAKRNSATRLAQAIQRFQRAVGAKPSPQDLLRDHVRQQQAMRESGARNVRVTDLGPNPSMIDRQAAWSRGGSSAGRGDYRRGAFPGSAYGRRVAPGARNR